MKKIVLSIAIICAFYISGCNTVQGAGRDLESLGGAIQGK